jgi:hypothetical protein
MMMGPAIQHVQGRLSGISPKMLTRRLVGAIVPVGAPALEAGTVTVEVTV